MRRTSATSRADGVVADEAGFTLIELLVVLAILALATGWIAVRAGAFLGGNVGTAAADARRALVNCRTQAQIAGVPVLCKVDAVARRVGSVTLKGSPDRLELAGGTTDGSVLFYPTGEASPARLLVGKGSEEKYLDISAVTGRVRVLVDDAG
ncbi:MAG TPA: prepilin-type N-terminal cleavage/methylation domain-containing protein [Geminicoccus sp.]|jgi:prepilin-type N-terminal cleavage/methylation domain-containing protein|uniref:prepilin-type N-terminal cleavage/methylation domain-containing protein n=1 Tax=Geminicoccus sp. TaxID=2024832 RepID=UPI002E36FC67|nr:prepilin-type N-terminal cleavage/methylation domain-containing protein [Geminicoccus sp.]HEX2529772.1 prepilin-type N-terminal cleavage/methylation domain-containing protein [Geminicoccus sp.]